MTKNKTKICLEINSQLWKKFKHKCVEEDKKLSEKIEEMIKKEV